MKLIILLSMLLIGASFFLGVLLGANGGFGPFKTYPMVLLKGELLSDKKPEYIIKWMGRKEFNEWNNFDPWEKL